MAWKLTLTVTAMDYTVLTTQMTKTTPSGFLDVLPFHFPFFYYFVIFNPIHIYCLKTHKCGQDNHNKFTSTSTSNLLLEDIKH